jgi:hypothetical protein
MEKICIGFGEHENKCTNIAGTPWSPYWCERCNKLRLEHITRQMEAILQKRIEGEGKC